MTTRPHSSESGRFVFEINFDAHNPLIKLYCHSCRSTEATKALLTQNGKSCNLQIKIRNELGKEDKRWRGRARSH